LKVRESPLSRKQIHKANQFPQNTFPRKMTMAQHDSATTTAASGVFPQEFPMRPQTITRTLGIDRDTLRNRWDLGADAEVSREKLLEILRDQTQLRGRRSPETAEIAARWLAEMGETATVSVAPKAAEKATGEPARPIVVVSAAPKMEAEKIAKPATEKTPEPAKAIAEMRESKPAEKVVPAKANSHEVFFSIENELDAINYLSICIGLVSSWAFGGWMSFYVAVFMGLIVNFTIRVSRNPAMRSAAPIAIGLGLICETVWAFMHRKNLSDLLKDTKHLPFEYETCATILASLTLVISFAAFLLRWRQNRDARKAHETEKEARERAERYTKGDYSL
jgi:hypothetical protein